MLEFNTFTLTPLAIAFCVAGLFRAYGLRGSTGFGGALGMAMLVVVIPIKIVVPAWTLLSIASSLAGCECRPADEPLDPWWLAR